MNERSPDAVIRPMRPEDVADAERLTGEAYLASDREMLPRSAPDPAPRGAQHRREWADRTAHLLATDPAGCWVAERSGVPVGVAISYRRDLLWLLASYAVSPGLRGQGIGRPLLEAALSHSRGCLRGMLSASQDPRAYRRYRLAGFTLHPQVRLHGVVDRARLPVVEHVREGSLGDVDLMDSLDRQRREAAHGVDHRLLTQQLRLVVTDHSTGSGYAYLGADGTPRLLAASNRRTAARLLWEALGSTEPGSEVTVAHVTTPNEWAVDVGLTAGLAVGQAGYLALRGMRPPMPYLHHGSLL